MKKIDVSTKKKYKRVKRIVILLSLMTAIIASTMAFLIVVSSIQWGQTPSFMGFMQKIQYNSVADKWGSDRFVQSTAYVCNLSSNEFTKVICVNDIIKWNYEYVNHGLAYELRSSPEEVILTGGVCRDWAVLYKSIFDVLGIKNELVLEPKHIYNLVYIDNEVWYVDMGVIYRS